MKANTLQDLSAELAADSNAIISRGADALLRMASKRREDNDKMFPLEGKLMALEWKDEDTTHQWTTAMSLSEISLRKRELENGAAPKHKRELQSWEYRQDCLEQDQEKRECEAERIRKDLHSLRLDREREDNMLSQPACCLYYECW